MNNEPGNQRLLRRYADAVLAGAPERCWQLHAEDVVIHYPGRSSLAGIHRGRAALRHLADRQLELTAGSLRSVVHAIVAGKQYGLVLETLQAARPGGWLEVDLAVVLKFRAGQIGEVWFYPFDQYALDDLFASSRDEPIVHTRVGGRGC